MAKDAACPVHSDWESLMFVLASLERLDDATIQQARLRLEPFLADSDSLTAYLATAGIDAIDSTLHVRRGAEAWCFGHN